MRLDGGLSVAIGFSRLDSVPLTKLFFLALDKAAVGAQNWQVCGCAWRVRERVMRTVGANVSRAMVVDLALWDFGKGLIHARDTCGLSVVFVSELARACCVCRQTVCRKMKVSAEPIRRTIRGISVYGCSYDLLSISHQPQMVLHSEGLENDY